MGMMKKAFPVVSSVPFYTQGHMVPGLHAPTYTRVQVHMYIHTQAKRHAYMKVHMYSNMHVHR